MIPAATKDVRAPRTVIKGGPAINVSVFGVGDKGGIDTVWCACALPTASVCTGAIHIPEI